MEKAGILHSKHDRLLLFKRKSEVIFVYIFLVIFFIAAMLLSDRFMTERNLRNLIISNIGLLFVAYGQLFIVLLGGVDLSVGSVISLTNVICVTMITENPSTWFLAFIASLAAGAGVGLVNGLLVVRGRLQPIIATLATQTFFAGVALYIMPGPEGILPSELCKFITKGWNYLFPLFLTLIVSTVVWLLLNRSRFGRAVLAVGGNEQSAKSSGISVGTVKIKSFIFTSLMAVMAGRAVYIGLCYLRKPADWRGVLPAFHHRGCGGRSCSSRRKRKRGWLYRGSRNPGDCEQSFEPERSIFLLSVRTSRCDLDSGASDQCGPHEQEVEGRRGI